MYKVHLVFLLLATIISVCNAYHLEKDRKRKFPNNRPFMWGYYQGTATIAFSMIFMMTFLMNAVETGEVANQYGVILVVGIFFAFKGVMGILILNRKRYALVFNTILSFSIPIWIVNYFYIKNRWQELSSIESVANEEQRASRSESQRFTPRKICINCEKRFEVVRMRNAEDGEFYECHICKRKAGGRFVYEVTDDEIEDVSPGFVATRSA